MGEDRRAEDKRIDEIHKDVKEIYGVLLGEKGVCVRLSVAENAIKSTQNELTEHKVNNKEEKKDIKENKWRITDTLFAVGMLIVAIIALFKHG